MAYTHNTFNFQEIVDLPQTELNTRTKVALDEFMLALRTNDQIVQKGRIYQAYEDERMKRLDHSRGKFVGVS